jgi:UDP-glucose 4-epimerase
MEQISIIGGTSPLGIDLAIHLAGLGRRVIASFRDPSRIPSQFDSRIDTAQLDLTENADFAPFLSKGVSVVWLAHLNQGRFNAQEAGTNTAAFERFLNAAAGSNIEQIVFISSGGSVYGEPRELPVTEDHPLAPLSSYGRAKAAMERLLAERMSSERVRTAILRPGNIYGFSDPNRDHKGIVAAFLKSITSSAPFTLIHDGRTVRDFIHVGDVVRAIAVAIDSPRENVVWNVATGTGSATGEVIARVREIIGLAMPEVHHISNFTSDVEQNILSIGRITEQSDWRPSTSLDEGLERTVRAYLAATSA